MEQNRKKLYTVGIDIGGTNTVFGIVDEQGHILSHDGIKTKDYPDINVYADTVAGHLRSLIEAAGGIELINGIGVGATIQDKSNKHPICLGKARSPWHACFGNA